MATTPVSWDRSRNSRNMPREMSSAPLYRSRVDSGVWPPALPPRLRCSASVRSDHFSMCSAMLRTAWFPLHRGTSAWASARTSPASSSMNGAAAGVFTR